MLSELKKINDYLFVFTSSVFFRLFVIAFLVYLISGGNISTDTISTKLIPLSLIKEFDFDLNEFQSTNFGVPLTRLNSLNVNGRLLSKYPVFTSIISVPFYLPFVVLGYSDLEVVQQAGALASAFIVALSVAFLYLALKEIADERKAFYCSLIYAFATCAWSISSQDLWQHGSVQLFLSISIYLLLKGLKDEKYVAYSGFTLACMVASRPPVLLIALVLTVYVFHKHRNIFPKFVFYALPPTVLLFSYSWVYFGSFLLMGQGQNPFEHWSASVLDGVLGLLISPSKGLFTHSPVLVLSFVGIYLAWTKRDTLLTYLSVSAFVMILLWGAFVWDGGLSYGYRLIVDVTPILSLFLASVLERYYELRWFKTVLILLIVYSVLVQFVGALFFDDGWYVNHLKCDVTGDYSCFWSIQDSQLVYYFQKASSVLTRIFS